MTGQRRILIVEDSEASRHQPQRVVAADPGVDVDAVRGATEVLALLARRHDSLVLLELDMPGVSGMQVLEAVR